MERTLSTDQFPPECALVG